MKTIDDAKDLAARLNDILRAKGYVQSEIDVSISADGAMKAGGYYRHPEKEGDPRYYGEFFHVRGSADEIEAKALTRMTEIPLVVDTLVDLLRDTVARSIDLAERVGSVSPELTEASDRVAEILRKHLATNRIEVV